MRRRAKVDANQSQIVDALRSIGCTVQDLSRVGGGCPDLLVGRAGVNWLMEIKDGGKAPSARKLRGLQVGWHARWEGTVHVVESVDQAVRLVLGRGLGGGFADLFGCDRP